MAVIGCVRGQCSSAVIRISITTNPTSPDGDIQGVDTRTSLSATDPYRDCAHKGGVVSEVRFSGFDGLHWRRGQVGLYWNAQHQQLLAGRAGRYHYTALTQ